MELYAFWRGESRAYTFTAKALDKNLDCALFRENACQFRYLHFVLLVAGGGKHRPTFECTKNVGLLQHKATLMEEELRHDNAIFPDVLPPALLTPATQPPPESPNQQPPPAVKRAVRGLGLGDQQSAESSPLQALERSSTPASVQDWLPMDNHYLRPPPAPRRDQTPLSCSEYDAEYESDGYPQSPPPLKFFHNWRKRPEPLGFVNTRLY